MSSAPSPPQSGRDRLRELLDCVLPGHGTVEADGVQQMARHSHVSEFHFSREVRRLTGESPAALRRRVMLERAAWRLGRGERVADVAAAEGWSSPEVFSRAFRRGFGVAPSRHSERDGFRLPAPNGLHFHPPQSLWIDAEVAQQADVAVSRLLVDHDCADTAYLLERAAELTNDQWTQHVAPGQLVLDWDGPEPSVAAVLAATVWTKQVWLASIGGQDFPVRIDPESTTPESIAALHEQVSADWSIMVAEMSEQNRLADTVIDALCDPPESFQVFGIIAHVLTYAAHRRAVARVMLAQCGVSTHRGDPLEWMRGPR